ncbi:MAG: hypothetical protein V1815_02020 [Candidatus Woesearchaeota archaeon]
MQKRILSIYVNLQDRELNLPDYLDRKHLIISICPYSIIGGTFSDKGIEQVKKLLGRFGVSLGQRGYLGRCKCSHDDGTDPWHENFCLYNETINLEDQLDFMIKGKDVLTKTFGIEPLIYAPINHLYDDNTIKAAQILKYRFMMDQNNIGPELRPYEKHEIVIIPEASIEKEGTLESVAFYTHVGHLESEFYEVVKYIQGHKYISPLGVAPTKIPIDILRINEIKKRIKKLERDERKLKGFAC